MNKEKTPYDQIKRIIIENKVSYAELKNIFDNIEQLYIFNSIMTEKLSD